MVAKEADDDAADSTPRKHVLERSIFPRQDSGPSSERKAPAHVKSSTSIGVETHNTKQRKPTITGQERSKHIPHRAEFQHVSDLQHVLSKSKSSPAIGFFTNSAPRTHLDSAATYQNYGDEDSGIQARNYGRGQDYAHQGRDNLHTAPHYLSRTTCPPNEHTASLSRGRRENVTGLGIGSVQLADGIQDDDGITPIPAPRVRPRSPIKTLFGPGGYLGNSGNPNSPGDPKYVKAKPGMLAKFIVSEPQP